MISASHNPAEDNGIKFFGPDGFKLSDAAEEEIEALLKAGVRPAQAGHIGRAKRIDDGRFRYVERVQEHLSRRVQPVGAARGARLRQWRVPTAPRPRCLWELGAEVVAMGVSPDGHNINDGVGSTATQAAAARIPGDSRRCGHLPRR